MKTSIPLILFFFCAITGIQSQGWERVYEKGDVQVATGVGLNANGEILFMGHDGNVSDRFHFLTVNAQGDTIRSASKEQSPSVLRDAILTQDGGMLLSGVLDNSTRTLFATKMDSLANEEWSINLQNDSDDPIVACEGPNQEYYLAYYNADFMSDSVFFYPKVTKLDKDGGIIFTKSYSGFADSMGGYLWARKAIATSDNGVLVSYSKGYNATGERRVNLLKIDAQGLEEWQREYDLENAEDLIEADNGDFLMTGDFWGGGITEFDAITIRINSTGDIIWTRKQGNPGTNGAKSITPTLDGNYYVAGQFERPGKNSPAVHLSKLTADGQVLWSHFYDKRGRATWTTEVMTAEDGGAYIGGTYTSILGEFDYYLIKTDTNGISLSNEVLGLVYHDENKDCLPDANESGLSDWIVNMSAGTNLNFYANTDYFGNYSVPAQEGDYLLKAFPPSPYWESCEEEYPVTFTANDFEVETIDIPVQAIVDCPYLEVSLGVAALRPCFDNNYTVQYCNNGTVTAQDAYLEIELDSLLTIVSADIPYTELNGILTFQLDSVPVSTCETFNFVAFLDCDATVGLTFCAAAHIYPDSLCLPVPNWSGASVELDATCDNGEVTFTLENVGSAKTTQAVQYYVVEDDVILFQGSINELLVGEKKSLSPITAAGATFRMESSQEPNHPGFNIPSIGIEGCTTGSDPLSLGFINLYAQNDADPFVDIECIRSTAAYDPNDKQGLPLGVGTENLIKQNQAIEYRLRFQNIGTDTAFNVVILDTLTHLLDIPLFALARLPIPMSLNCMEMVL